MVLGIEAVLKGHPCVRDAAAIDLTDRGGRRQFGAVVQLATPLPDPAAELTEYCRSRLPASSVPVRWVFTGDGASAVHVPRQSPRAPHLEL